MYTFNLYTLVLRLHKYLYIYFFKLLSTQIIILLPKYFPRRVDVKKMYSKELKRLPQHLCKSVLLTYVFDIYAQDSVLISKRKMQVSQGQAV